MRAIQVSAGGDPSVARLVTLPDPEPGPGTVLVEVSHAGVNFADVAMRRGEMRTPFPMVLGVEGAGVVRAVGPGVDALAPGDRVAWSPTAVASSIGSYAELAVVGVDQAVPVPATIPLELAAASVLQGLTAHYLVHEIRPVTSGTRVLVHAAAGGTGRAVVQWLRHLGAEVFATVGSPGKAAVAAAAGAQHVLDTSSGDVVEWVRAGTLGSGVDYVVDGVGGPDFCRNFALLAPFGTVCVFGRAAGPPAPFSAMDLVPKGLSVRGALSSQFLRSRDETLRKAGEVWAGLLEGWFAPQVHSVRPLEDAAEAHRLLESRATTGKLVLSAR